MTKNKSVIYLLFFTMLLTACDAITGEEVARIPVNAISTNENLIIKEVSIDLKKDDEIIFWSEMNIEYEGDVDLRFRVQILKNGKEFGGIEVDPTDKNITLNEVKTTLMDKTSWSFTGRNTKLKIEDNANYTFKALLVSSVNPTLKVNKAEIIIKK